jgi:hypothetical protein
MMALVLLGSLAATPVEAPSRLSVTLESLGSVSLTQARTQGGLGGAVGVAYAVSPSWQAQARVAWLWGLGSHTLLRVGGGWQRPEGLWRPLLRLDVALGLGGALDFGVGGQPPSRAPTLGLVVGASLLRFQLDRVALSALELEGGLSTEFLSIGPRVGVGLLAVTVQL